MKTIIPLTFAMETYLDKINAGDIRNDSDVQRNFVWGNEQINELAFTVLNGGHIPEILLGEKDDSQLVIIDGGQRTYALNKIRRNNHRITSLIDDSIIHYKKKITVNGETVSEDREFNIKNTRYNDWPEELRKKFDEFQLRTVVFYGCDDHEIAKYIKIYNNHVAMNVSQKAFTYIDNFADSVRSILKCPFFLNDYSNFKEKEKVKGEMERVVVETIMCSYHLADWKKQLKAICTYLNKNGSKSEFKKLEDNLHRLERIIADDVKDLFNLRDAFIFLTLFDKFTKLGFDDGRFIDFLREFKNGLKKVEIDGISFSKLEEDKRSTKDKSFIIAKLDLLEKLMHNFLDIEDVTNSYDEKSFLMEFAGVSEEDINEDISLYKDSLNYIKENMIKFDSKLLEENNSLSLLAIVAYSFKNDLDLDDWITDFSDKHSTYIIDQKANFLLMKEDLDNFILNKK